MSLNIKVTGLRELNKNLKKLKGRQAQNVIAASLRAGGRVIVKEARTRLDPEYETLSKSLTVKVKRRRSPYVLNAVIGPTTGRKAKFDGWYAHFVEFGVDPHELTIKSKKVMNIGDDNFATTASHPGIKAKPFLRPAVDSTLRQIEKAYSKKMWEGIRKLLR